MAQKVTVSGLIMDGALNEPLAGASVVLLQPKDSAQATGVSSDLEGKFKLPAVKAGNYIFRVSYIGFQTYYRNITLTKGNKSVNLGSITLEENSKVLKEAEVTAKLAQVEMKADTFIFNAEAYRLPEGSMLEELVKKLPGAEIDDDGNIKINGKSVSKIMVDGKEYFQNDTKMAMKNLPSKLIKKLKSYDKKSDYTRITGIDDGEEETVLDLSVKKGMKEGWVGNIDGAYGTEDRYSGKVNVNRFLDNSYLSIIGSRNNVNDFGGRWGGGGNGITTSTMGGVTFAWENGKPDYSAGLLKLGGNVRYSSSDSESQSRTNSEMFLPSGISQFSNSKNQGTNWGQNVNANFRLEWFPDSMTNIMFRPNFSHSNGNSSSDSRSVTFNQSPFEAGLTDPVEEYKDWSDPNNIDIGATMIGNAHNGNITTKYGTIRVKKDGSNYTHYGVDYASPNGTEILAPDVGAPLRVTRVHNDPNGYGNYVDLQGTLNGHTLEFRIAHMQDGVNVNAGDTLRAGDLIGLSGNTGNSRGKNGGYHMHLEIKLDGKPTDPTKFIETIQPYIARGTNGAFIRPDNKVISMEDFNNLVSPTPLT